MKRIHYFLFATIVVTSSLIGCTKPDEPNQPADKQDTIASSYPRKLLIEHFTGQACGYCPLGMEYIEEFIKKQGAENVIWISNHSGFSDDSYTIKDSKRLASKFNVDGAPAVMLNREKQSYYDEDTWRDTKATVFHPYYLSTLSDLKLETTVSVNIANHYDASSRQLNIEVNGTMAESVDELLIVVAIKESGLHGAQADYYETWEGWQDFVHNHAVRAYLTDIAGDDQLIVNRHYTFSTTYKLNDAWNADNCSVVAYLTDGNGVVLNAEQAPVVEGTKGGEDIQGGGVTVVEIPDSYPEYESVPDAATNLELDSIIFFSKGSTAKGYSHMLILFPSQTKVSGNVPVFYTELILESETSTLPDGTYSFLTTGNAGSAVAGQRNDSSHEILGSMFILADAYYFSMGYLSGSQWLLADGSITVSTTDVATSITISATTLIGSTLTATYSKPLSAAAPAPSAGAIRRFQLRRK